MLETILVMGAVALLFFFALYGTAILVTTVYLHRCVAHGGVTLGPRLTMGCRVLCWLSTGVKPRQWARVHRWHHLWEDSPSDPHSPVNHGGGWRGALFVFFHNVGLYSAATQLGEIEQKYPELSEAQRDRWDARVFDKTSQGLLVGIAIAAALLGFLGLMLFGLAGALTGVTAGVAACLLYAPAYMLVGGAVNGFGHRRRVPHPGSGSWASNVWLLVPLAAGEGRHEYHHAAPNSPRFAVGRQIDPGWLAIRVLQGLRLARVTERGHRGIERLEQQYRGGAAVRA